MNSILFWNEVAVEANRQAHTTNPDRGTIGPTVSSRAFAIVHLAMYDAYAAVRRSQGAAPQPNGFPAPYLSALPPLDGANDALEAAAGAAFTALTALYPSQTLFFLEKKQDAGIPGGPASASFHFGEDVAKTLLELRRNDPIAPFPPGYVPPEGRGKHRVDPDNPDQGIYGPYYGALSHGFAINHRHELLPPPDLGSPEYAAALQQVRFKGIKSELMGTLPPPPGPEKRSATETVIGIFWAYDGAFGLGTPPRLYNQIVSQLAKSRLSADAVKNDDDHARLFALVNAAMGDAGILAWDQKYEHSLWRPVLGIREHDPSLGPKSAATKPSSDLAIGSDTQWLPLGAPASNTQTKSKNFTPNFPAYPSGHATFGAAALHMARLFYGIPEGDRKPDKLFKDEVFVSDEFNGKTMDNLSVVRPRHERKFDGGLWQMIVENCESRIYLGVHWIFDAFALAKDGKTPDLKRNVGGLPLGLKIAEDIWGKGKGLKQSAVGPRTA